MRVEWEILMTTQVEGFLDDLYDADPVSHRLVNQAILVLERNGPADGTPTGRHGDRVADRQHERVTAAVGRAERGADLAGLRPVAVGGPAGGRRQVRPVVAVVSHGDPAG
jgi:hypothetical protein